MNWSECVRAGRALNRKDQSLQWEWGDLAVNAVASFKGAKNENGRPTIERALRAWLEAIGYDGPYGTISRLYYLAKAWPPETRVSRCSVSAHIALTSNPLRFDLLKPGMTKQQAMDANDEDNLRRLHYVGNYTIADALDFAGAAARFIRKSKRIIRATGVDKLSNTETEAAMERAQRTINHAQGIIDLLQSRDNPKARAKRGAAVSKRKEAAVA